MSEIRDMLVSALLTSDGKLIQGGSIKVGDLVRWLYSSSLGTVVEIIDKNNVRVLFGEFSNPFDGILGATRPRIPYDKIAQTMFPVQEMPSGALEFYLEKVHEDMDKKD